MRRPTYILDACALLVYLTRAPGWEKVSIALTDAESDCCAHVFALYEVCHWARQQGCGEGQMKALVDDLVAAGLSPKEDADLGLCLSAADLRAEHGLPAGDAFSIALAQRMGATLLTTHRGDFADAAKARDCRVRPLR